MNPEYYQQCPTFKYEETEEGSDGMEVVRQEEEDTTPPFHHILNEQAKSLIALQELQNEVGALLEFREVVMEAFPQLRAKLRSGGGGGRWEPGVRVRRKARPEEPRSRSNSRSSKAASSVVADSGFCTKPAEPSEDELWTLLELIQAKGTRLRLEAETLRSRSLPHQDNHQDRLHALIQERDRLVARLGEMERESAARAEEACRLEERVAELTREKERLESALATTGGTPRLGTLDGIVSSPGERIVCQSGVSPNKEVTAAILRETNVLELQRHLITTVYESQERDRLVARLGEMERESAARAEEACRLEERVAELTREKERLESALATTGGTPRLGTLDGIVSSPGERIVCQSGVSPNKEVTAAILRETNVLELQRHLITTVYESQVAGKRLDRLTRIREGLLRQLDKCKEENEDLKFQLEEKSIELEGTRARVRLLERTQTSSGADDANSSTESAGQGSSSGETPKRPRSRIPLKANPPSSSKPPRPPPLASSGGRKPPPPPPLHQNGVDHDSLESHELDRSMRSEIVVHQPRPQSSLLRAGKASTGTSVKKKKDHDSIPQYFDSIDSAKLDSDSLDMV